MKNIKKALPVIIFIIIILGLYYFLLKNQYDDPNYYEIVNIVDGDTIDININGKTERVRLIGIDTPELVDPRQEVECFAQEASDRAKEILTGQKVRLESDLTQGDRDKYNRLLRYVFLENGASLNQMMIEEGYAHEYTYDLPYKYQEIFQTAEQGSRTSGLGLWKEGVCDDFK
ncbi:MAG: thermonuclease family protein [bacterium]